MPKCSNCGAELKNNAAVCTFCGAQIPKGSPAIPSASGRSEYEAVNIAAQSHTQQEPQIREQNVSNTKAQEPKADEIKLDEPTAEAQKEQEQVTLCYQSKSRNHQSGKKTTSYLKTAKTVIIIKPIVMALLLIVMSAVYLLASLVGIGFMGIIINESENVEAEEQLPSAPQEKPVAPDAENPEIAEDEPSEFFIVMTTLSGMSLILLICFLGFCLYIAILLLFVLSIIFAISTTSKLKKASCKRDMQKQSILCLIFCSVIGGTLLLCAPEEEFTRT